MCRCLSLLTLLFVCGPAWAEPRLDRYGDPLPPGAVARLGSDRLRAGQPGCAFAVSPDGKLLVTGERQRVRIWNLADGKELRSLSLPDAVSVYNIRFAPDGKRFAVRVDHQGHVSRAFADRESVYVCDADAGTVIHEIWGGAYRPILFLCSGKVLALRKGSTLTPHQDGPVHLWDTETWREIGTIPNVHNCAGTPDGKTLVTAGNDGVVCLWDPATGRQLRNIPAHRDAVRAVAVSPDGKGIASAGGPRSDTKRWDREWKTAERAIRLWDGETGKEVRSFETPENPDAFVTGLRFSPDGRTLLGQDAKGTTWWWNVTTGKAMGRFTPPGDRAASGFRSALEFSPDGRTLVVSADNRELRFLDAADGTERRRWPNEADEIFRLDFTPDGKTLIFNGDSLRIRDVATGKDRFPVTGHRQAVRRLTFAPDGRTLLSADQQGTVRLWDAASGAGLVEMARTAEQWVSFTLLPDGPTLSWGLGGTGQLLDAETGKETRRLRDGRGGIIDRDGRTCIRHDGRPENGLQVYDLDTGHELRRVSPPSTGFGGFYKVELFHGPDGRAWGYLSTDPKHSEYSLREAATGRELCALHPRNGDCFALSPDGRFLVTAEDAVILRETASGQELGRFPLPHRGQVTALAFAPDGRTLATGGSDGVILLWDWAAAIEPPRPFNPWRRLRTWLTSPEQQRERQWQDLAGDARIAQDAVAALSRDGDAAVALFRERLRPVAEPNGLQRLLRDLGSEDFAVRERASAELAKCGAEIEPFLRHALRSDLDLEVRRRIEPIYAKLPLTTPTPEGLRQVRAVQTLEAIGSPEARQLLRTLAEGHPEALLTQEARGALARLERGRR
jgi:WD40 repeat protein